ncbi:MAG: hypothetical protein IJG47_12120, partial [Microbacterium sp.]|nr:hypothetical protein [Microbacterium sp.]
MSRPETPPIAVESAPVRWSRWWVASGALFLLTALLAAYRSLPGTLDGGVLSALSVATSAGFGLALIAAGFTRSTLPEPWRYTPAVVLAAVVLASLMEFFLLSGAVTDMNAIVLVANVLLLTRIVATGVLGAVALRAARSRADSVVVLGGR